MDIAFSGTFDDIRQEMEAFLRGNSGLGVDATVPAAPGPTVVIAAPEAPQPAPEKTPATLSVVNSILSRINSKSDAARYLRQVAKAGNSPEGGVPWADAVEQYGGGDAKVAGGRLQSIWKAQKNAKGEIWHWSEARRAFWMEPEIAAAVLALLGDDTD